MDRHAPSNNELRSLYDEVYRTGKEQFFTFSTDDVSREVLKEISWDGKAVLEVGCGTGETAKRIGEAGGRVVAVDYSAAAIDEAKRRNLHPNVRYEVKSFRDIAGEYDVVVAQEVIEHTDDPLEFLRAVRQCVRTGGKVLVTCPAFMNLRGIVWMTLQLLFRVPMSLSDKHFISPDQMEAWAQALGMTCAWRTFRHSQGHGEQMVIDLKKRLPKALADAGLDRSGVDDLIAWLERAGHYESDRASNGAKALYHLTVAPDASAMRGSNG